MITKGIIHSTTTPPTRLDVVKWVESEMREMKGEGKIVWNAWRKTGFEWFVDKDVNGDVDREGEEGKA
jgi:hypothetical protein